MTNQIAVNRDLLDKEIEITPTEWGSGSFTGDTNTQYTLTNFSRILLHPATAIRNLTLDSPGAEVILLPGAGHQIIDCKLNGVSITGRDVGRVVLENLYLTNMNSHAITLTNSREFNRIHGVEVLGVGAVGGKFEHAGIRLINCDLVHLSDVFVIGCEAGCIILGSWVSGSCITMDSCLEGIVISDSIEFKTKSNVTLNGTNIRAHGTGIKIDSAEAVCISGSLIKGSDKGMEVVYACKQLSIDGCWVTGNDGKVARSIIMPRNLIGSSKQFAKLAYV